MFVSKFTFTFDCHELLNHFWTVKLFMFLLHLMIVMERIGIVYFWPCVSVY